MIAQIVALITIGLLTYSIITQLSNGKLNYAQGQEELDEKTSSESSKMQQDIDEWVDKPTYSDTQQTFMSGIKKIGNTNSTVNFASKESQDSEGSNAAESVLPSDKIKSDAGNQTFTGNSSSGPIIGTLIGDAIGDFVKNDNDDEAAEKKMNPALKSNQSNSLSNDKNSDNVNTTSRYN